MKPTASLRFLLLLIALTVLMVLTVPQLLLRLGATEEYPCAPRSEKENLFPVLADSGVTDVRFAWLAEDQSLLYQNHEGLIYIVTTDDGRSEEPQRLNGFTGYMLDISGNNQLIALTEVDETVNVYELQSGDRMAEIPDAVRGLWLPDRSTLTIANRHNKNITLVSLKSTNSAVPIAGYRSFIFPVSWSRDGRFLAGIASPDRSQRIVVVTSRSSDVEMLTDLERCQASPTWAPNTNQVAYVANPDMQWDLFVQDWPEGTAARLVHTTQTDEYQPSWSPDGRYLAYVGFRLTAEGAPAQELYVVEVATGISRRLTETPGVYESRPLWSPQGDKIAYLSFANEGWFLNIMAPDGSGQVKLATIGQRE